jgi:nicotinamide mononucleotide adenylyltransferase
VSSTKVRLFLKRGLSVRYLLPGPVVEYIEERGLYQDGDGVPPPKNEEKRDEEGVRVQDFASTSALASGLATTS